MTEQLRLTLNHLSLFCFTDAYWLMNENAKASFHRHWLESLAAATANFDVYQNADSRADLLLWCVAAAEEPAAPATFFEKLTTVMTPFRHVIRPVQSLWGFTRPSLDSQARSAQEIDPFSTTRMRYLVTYPFGQSAEWYRTSRENRLAVMNEHIRLGQQYEDIRQLLLFSFGLQDYEFVVLWETDDLVRFSDLTNDLRDRLERQYTQQVAPLYTAIYHPAPQALALWK